MNIEFQNCLKNNKIRPFSRGRVLFSKEIKLARHDLKTARQSLKDKNFKWATIQAYYSMFHTSRALIYKKNYREKSHYCPIVAIRKLYIETKKLNFAFVENLERAKTLRENADYYGNYSEITAKDLIQKAGAFLNKAKGILGSDKNKLL